MVKIILKMKTKKTILLTTTVRINENLHWLFQRDKNHRLEIYLKSIKQWLDKTDLNICVVENSGYTFPELDDYKEKYRDRFEILGYDENTYEETKHLKDSVSKGQCELYALNYAYDNSRLIAESFFIIKITGRYFIPGFEKYLSNVDLSKYDTMQQNNNDRCELVGVSKYYFKTIFDKKMSYPNGGAFMPHMESFLCYQIGMCILKKRKLTCPLFEIEETLGGGNNEPFTNI